MNLNPMFNLKERFKTKAIRKKRSDKKIDVKVPISNNQRRTLRTLGFSEKLSMTQYATKVVAEGLEFQEIQEVSLLSNYEDTKLYVHLRLSNEQHEKLQKLSIFWDVSVRQAGFRVLHFMIRENFLEG